MPKVSVIIPTYNRVEHLIPAIKSVIDQTYQNFELIVSDDGSTDSTRQTVNALNSSKVRYIPNKGSKGPGGNRNNGISHARGEYIAFLDDDDEWLPKKLQYQVNILNKSSSTICGVFTNVNFKDKKSGQLIKRNPLFFNRRQNLIRQLIIKSPIYTSTAMIKRTCLEKVGRFDESIPYMEDLDLWIKLSLKWQFEYLSLPMINYYVHSDDQMSKNIQGQIAGKEKLFKRYPFLFQQDRKRWSRYLLSLGVHYCQINNMKQGRINIFKSICVYPFKKIAYFQLFASLFSPKNYLRLKNLYKNHC